MIGEKVTCRIPKVTIEGVDTSAINKKMYKSFDKDGYFDYEFYIGKTYVSILCDWSMDGGASFWSYNISRRTGKQMTRAELLAEFGVTNAQFNARVKKAIMKEWTKKERSKFKKAYKKAISTKNLNKASAYVNKKGKLCFIADDNRPYNGYGEPVLGTY